MNSFISLGIAVIVGIIVGQVTNRFKIPAVAGYIIAGLIIGISGLKIVDSQVLENLSFISDFALGIIAFSIGSELEVSVIKKLGKTIFIIATCEALGAFVLVTAAMFFITKDVPTALILGAVASATAPAATLMVLKEYNAKGPLTSTLLGVVAVDDAICLMIYAIASSIAKVFVKHEEVTMYKILFHPLAEIILSLSLGFVMGVILVFLINKSTKGNELLPYITGIIILNIGISLKFDLSPLLSSMTIGVIVANVSSSSRKVFSTLESFSSPIIAAFFILAGSRLDISLLPHIGFVGLAYLMFRMAGKLFGASIGATISKAPATVKKYIGFGLFSQVGVAVGLAIIVSREFQGTQLGSLVITILLGTTIITELIGPMCTKTAIIKAKEANI
ncbi:cation:proton antiporter [Clostridium grantii]|uniref:Transporter, CPA2 family n=1 Tax=Clostridium grantii DSM 8605 TaxID=1121316 RepID=A0A1M5UL21_9CLOT|nr:cation:proton antiporter [Clostridium grantii]SHH63661.1 transporter, CPA2 family [Clostridium grantii DSM 8605]